MYDYVKNYYGVNPVVGSRVCLLDNSGKLGVIARENKSQAHYVYVLFDGKKHADPVHPMDLNYVCEEE